MKKYCFKNMPSSDLLNHYNERKSEVDRIEKEIKEYTRQLKIMKTQGLLASQRLQTVNHWINSRRIK